MKDTRYYATGRRKESVARVWMTPGSGEFPGGRNGSPLRLLAWGIPWAEEPGGLQSTESHRDGHD